MVSSLFSSTDTGGSVETWHQIRVRMLLIIQDLDEIVDLKFQLNDADSGIVATRIEILSDVKMELKQTCSMLRYRDRYHVEISTSR